MWCRLFSQPKHESVRTVRVATDCSLSPAVLLCRYPPLALRVPLLRSVHVSVAASAGCGAVACVRGIPMYGTAADCRLPTSDPQISDEPRISENTIVGMSEEACHQLSVMRVTRFFNDPTTSQRSRPSNTSRSSSRGESEYTRAQTHENRSTRGHLPVRSTAEPELWRRRAGDFWTNQTRERRFE